MSYYRMCALTFPRSRRRYEPFEDETYQPALLSGLARQRENLIPIQHHTNRIFLRTTSRYSRSRGSPERKVCALLDPCWRCTKQQCLCFAVIFQKQFTAASGCSIRASRRSLALNCMRPNSPVCYREMMLRVRTLRSLEDNPPWALSSTAGTVSGYGTNHKQKPLSGHRTFSLKYI